MIDEMMIALIILIIGVILLVVEAAAPGNFIIIPATILTIVGAVFAVYPDYLFTMYAPILAIVVALISSVLSIQLYKRISPEAPPTTLVGTSLIGRTGMVVTMITPNTMLGKVRIDGEVWSANAEVPIAAGVPVKVISSEGVHVKVEEISQAEFDGAQQKRQEYTQPIASQPAAKQNGNEKAIVVTLISPGLGIGKVKVGDEVFNATADCNIYAGTEVEIISRNEDGTVKVAEL